MNKPLRKAAIILALTVFLSDQTKAQWTISPSVGVEFALPRYESFNYTWTRQFIKIPDNPQLTLHLGLGISREISEKWSLFTHVATLRYKFPVKGIPPNPIEATGQYSNIRGTFGAQHAVADNLSLGLGISLDYSYNFRYHDEEGERLDRERKYNITRDLGLNFNATYHFENFFLALQINKAIIPLVSRDKKNIMEHEREIEPLSAIIVTCGYSFRF